MYEYSDDYTCTLKVGVYLNSDENNFDLLTIKKISTEEIDYE